MREKWTNILLISILLQIIISLLTWFLQVIQHEALLIIIFASFVSIIIQFIGYFEILRRARDLDDRIFGEGRIPKKHQNIEFPKPNPD